MKIGIIGAMAVEVDGIKALMENKSTEKIGAVEYYSGTLGTAEAVVAEAGVGKVNAAVCAQTMILKYNPDIVINTGVAGGLSPELEIGDIAVATNVVEHDMDTTPVGDEPGYITGLNTVYIETDEEITDKLLNIANRLERIKAIKGTIASGDQFIASNEQREKIMHNFPTAIAAEMEGASIGHVCAMSQKPFAVLRAISDGANSGSVEDFPAFVKLAAKRSIEIMVNLLKEL